MPKIKLTYFDFPGGRGEDCRLALYIAGVEFEDDRVASGWADRKPETPFGSLPVMEIEGLGTLAQSNAILGFIGRGHGLHPTDPFEAARHESVMASAEDLRTSLTPTLRIKDDAEKKAAREEFARDYMQRWGAFMERQIRGPFVGGDTLNVADLKIYVLCRWFKSGGVDHISSDVFADFPKLNALYDAVHSHPKVAEWNARFAK